jgi:hypothetical protein
MVALAHALAQLRRDGGGPHLPSADQIDQLAARRGVRFRDTPLTPGNTLGLFVRQVAHGNVACAAVQHLAGFAFSDSAWCQARARLPIDLIRDVHRQVLAAADQADEAGGGGDDGRRFHGHRVFVVDGTSDSMPDEPPLRAHYGVPAGCRPGLGFPTSHLLLLLMDHRRGLIVDCVDSPMNTSDVSRMPSTHAHMTAGDLLLGDDGFAGWPHLALLLQGNLHAVVPAHHLRRVDFTPGRPYAHPRKGKSSARVGKPTSRVVAALGDDDQLVEYFKPAGRPAWMDEARWAALPDSIEVREVRRTVRRKGFRPITVTIVTTLLDPERYPADELVELRLTRWTVETNIRHLKTTLGMDVLKCRTLDGVRKERLVFVLVYNLIRLIMLRAARTQRVNVDRLSFADTLAWLRHGDLGASPRLKVNPPRAARLEPRVIKRQKKEFPYMTRPRAELKAELRAAHGDGA